MKNFSASILLIFVILRGIQCPLALPSFSDVSSVLTKWNGNNSEGDKKEKEGVDPVQKESASMNERFQNMIFSNMPQVSDEMRVQFLVVLKTVLSNSFFGARYIIPPLIDPVIARYATKVPESSTLLTPDTTDALIFKLMSQQVNDQNLNEFLEISADSNMVKKATARFMKSLQEIADKYVDNYMRIIKNQVEKKLTA